MKLSLLSNFWIRWLLVSATYMLPFESVAIPSGSWNSPVPFPDVPHVFINLPLFFGTFEYDHFHSRQHTHCLLSR